MGVSTFIGPPKLREDRYRSFNRSASDRTVNAIVPFVYGSDHRPRLSGIEWCFVHGSRRRPLAA
jgi:hypothetical protein